MEDATWEASLRGRRGLSLVAPRHGSGLAPRPPHTLASVDEMSQIEVSDGDLSDSHL